MKPYQLRDDELVPDKDIYGLYRFLNGADTLVFRFTPDDGSETFSVTKTIGVSRIDAPDEEADPALYEFYSVFPADTLKEGTAYDLDIQAYDREGSAIEGMSCRLKLNCRQEQDK